MVSLIASVDLNLLLVIANSFPKEQLVSWQRHYSTIERIPLHVNPILTNS